MKVNIFSIHGPTQPRISFEVTCHQFADMEGAFYGVTRGLLTRRPASPILRDFILESLQLDGQDVDVQAGASSRHNECGFTNVHDVVLWRVDNDPISVGQVIAHCEVNGVPVTLLQVFGIVSYDPRASTYTLRETGDYRVTETEDVLDAVTWCFATQDELRCIVPRDLS